MDNFPVLSFGLLIIGIMIVFEPKALGVVLVVVGAGGLFWWMVSLTGLIEFQAWRP